MVLKIDGTDIVPYIAYGGVKWQRSDVDGEGAGRMLDGTLERNRMATKIRLDVTCRPLKSAEASIVLSAIMPEWVSVTYFDPQKGSTGRQTISGSNDAGAYLIKHPDGTEWWSGITFPLIEK